MNFNKLDSTEKLGVYGSVAVIVGAIVGGTVTSLGWLAFLAAVGMLAVIFLPQLSPQTRLPGTKGSLMIACGAVAGVIMLLGILVSLGWFGAYFSLFPIQSIFFLAAAIGGLVMAWAGWQAFQAEGGKFQIGSPEEPPAA